MFWWPTVPFPTPWMSCCSGVQLKAEWVDGVGCNITETNNKILIAIFIYSMCFDLIVLLLNTYKLIQLNAHAPVSEMFGQSRLTHMMWSDGLIYFFIAYVAISVSRRVWLMVLFNLFSFLANLVATIFMILNLNSIMNVIFNVPAAIASTVRVLYLPPPYQRNFFDI